MKNVVVEINDAIIMGGDQIHEIFVRHASRKQKRKCNKCQIKVLYRSAKSCTITM